MHWSEKIARSIIAKKPDKEEYVCAAGISPSGSIHIGNFRDIATSYFVVKALRKLGKKAKLLFSWDEFDRLRKVPKNVAAVNNDMEKYIGFPYVDVENPFKDSDAENYAVYFEKEFEASIKEFGIDMDYKHQAEMYRSGKYTDMVIHSLKKRKQIFDILDSHRTQEQTEGERDSYYPVSIYCPKCKRDTTKIISLDEETMVAEYECSCGHKGTFDFNKDFNCKLAWKVDWPMRWMYEGVDFEPGGKDHASKNGSYDTAKDVSRQIFGYEPPLFQGYEFIGISDNNLKAGKMSGSSGLNLTPGTLLKLYEPEVLLWLYSKNEPLKAFNFCLDDGILRQYFEFDKMLTDVREGKANDLVKDIMELCTIEGREVKCVPMGLIVQLGSVVDFNEDMLEIVFKKIKTPYTKADFADRLQRAKFWLEKCSPENVNKLNAFRNFDVYETLDEKEKEEIKQLFEFLSKGEYDLDSLQTELYAIPPRVYNIDKTNPELKQIQAKFFSNVYLLLIGKEKGPRLYLFLGALNLNSYIHLLDFSTPRREDEYEKEEIVEEVVEEKVYGEPDKVEPIKEEIDIDEFSKMDLRVCKITKVNDIRKSNNCYKLTLFDGIGERVIVSSIKHDYMIEELLNKKIIVVANLKPTRITGVTSEGMLLAGTNNACGCKVIFVDDMIPEGTKIK
ncbi:MAG: lysine--tRNA ligase [Clostridia bacterium]|nr:lysine--tRNA ligase [Clostridia bacterium]